MDFRAESSLSSHPPLLASLVAENVIKGGMIPKVEACVRVVRDGVEKAHIIDGRKHHAILLELLTDQGVGTMIRRN
ncbi:MAG TPA: hypothetical protein PK105_09165 [Rectinema sp.]|nr:hypothetical protein [Rectinema sp.]